MRPSVLAARHPTRVVFLRVTLFFFSSKTLSSRFQCKERSPASLNIVCCVAAAIKDTRWGPCAWVQSLSVGLPAADTRHPSIREWTIGTPKPNGSD
ncbi:hypothetical protein QBC44DRAFT_111717 [Cladorrhinum sp. PSN332]|nr:hypothetical protein QBC44DRAFT_111717 [Cladorrhinum sp. PSN332]